MQTTQSSAESCFAAETPASAKNFPAGQASHVVKTAIEVGEEMVCDALTVYVADVNKPSQPTSTAVIVVPVVMPVPEIVWPTAIVPDVRAVTVSVVPDIVPVNAAAAAL